MLQTSSQPLPALGGIITADLDKMRRRAQSVSHYKKRAVKIAEIIEPQTAIEKKFAKVFETSTRSIDPAKLIELSGLVNKAFPKKATQAEIRDWMNAHFEEQEARLN